MPRLPLILQTSSSDCGAACLTMLLAGFGRRVPLAAVRSGLGGRHGASALALVEAARRHGLVCRSLRVDEAPILGRLRLPAVLHWEERHFVILEMWGRRAVTLVDPALGRRRVSHAELAEGFSGVALLFTPGPGFRKGGSSGVSWRRYLGVAARAPGALAAIFGGSLALQLLGLAAPLATAYLVDRLAPGAKLPPGGAAAWGLAAFACATFGASLLRQRLLIALQARLDRELTSHFLRHLLSLPYPFFQRRTTADLLMRVNSNGIVREVLSDQLVSGVLDGLLVVLYLGLLLGMSPSLGLLAAALGAAQLGVMLLSISAVRPLAHRDMLAQARQQAYVVEALRGIATVKACAAEEHAFARWHSLFTEQLQASVSRQRRAAVYAAALGSIAFASPLVLLFAGVSLAAAGTLTLGRMLGSCALAAGFIGPLASLVGQGQRMQLVGAHLARLEDVFETPPEAGGGRDAARLQGGLKLRGVSFRYEPESPDVLSDVDLDVAPGSFVAIVGRSGSGKSTLAKLLSGLEVPTRGRVLYDGVDLRELDRASVRRRLGIVLQETSLFCDTIRGNIALGAPQTPPDAVRLAARRAAIHEEIAALPLGYETRLAESGGDFSGGQRQRIGLARALVREPAVLILDEATSALDTPCERRVQASLAALRATRVVIAHRLATVRDADLIVVLEAGGVVERGTHDELLAKGGAYARLVTRRDEPENAPFENAMTSFDTA